MSNPCSCPGCYELNGWLWVKHMILAHGETRSNIAYSNAQYFLAAIALYLQGRNQYQFDAKLIRAMKRDKDWPEIQAKALAAVLNGTAEGYYHLFERKVTVDL